MSAFGVDWPLAQAAREVNAKADEDGLLAALELAGLPFDLLHHLAEQRALRAVYAASGVNLDSPVPLALELTAEQKKLMPLLTAAYLDGLTIGYYGRQLEERNENDV